VLFSIKIYIYTCDFEIFDKNVFFVYFNQFEVVFQHLISSLYLLAFRTFFLSRKTSLYTNKPKIQNITHLNGWEEKVLPWSSAELLQRPTHHFFINHELLHVEGQPRYLRTGMLCTFYAKYLYIVYMFCSWHLWEKWAFFSPLLIHSKQLAEHFKLFL